MTTETVRHRNREMLFQYTPYWNGSDYQVFIDQVNCWLDANVPEGERLFYVEASKVGWRNHSGQTVLAAETGEDFVRGVAGLNCDFSARFWESNKWLCTAIISHHDSPTGEPRRVMTLHNWIKRQVNDYSIQKLQILLTKLRQTEYLFRGNWFGARWEWWDEDMVGKPRRQYSRKDFAHIFLQFYYETENLFLVDEYMEWAL